MSKYSSSQSQMEDGVCVWLCCKWCHKVFSTKFGLIEHGRRFHANDIFLEKLQKNDQQNGQNDHHHPPLQGEEEPKTVEEHSPSSKCDDNASAYMEEWNRWLQENSETDTDTVTNEEGSDDIEMTTVDRTRLKNPPMEMEGFEIDSPSPPPSTPPTIQSPSSSLAGEEKTETSSPIPWPPPSIENVNGRTSTTKSPTTTIPCIELIDLTEIDEQIMISPVNHSNNDKNNYAHQLKNGQEDEIAGKIGHYVQCLKQYKKLAFNETDWRKSDEGVLVLQKILKSTTPPIPPSSPQPQPREQKQSNQPFAGINMAVQQSRGWKSFNCRYCKQRFGSFDHLKTHEKNHRAEKDHACQFCRKKYALYANLKLHIMNNHCHKSSVTKTKSSIGAAKLVQTKLARMDKQEIIVTPPFQMLSDQQQQQPTDLSVKATAAARVENAAVSFCGEKVKKRLLALPTASELVLTCLTYQRPLRK